MHDLDYMPSNQRAIVGANNPPGPIDSAREAMDELSAWLKEHPVIQSHPEAKEGGGWVERTRIALGTMEDERKAKVDPINAKLTAINGAYRVVREPLEKTLKELRRRLTDFASAEEAKRIAELQRLADERNEAERLAREAEAREQDAIACADVGECADVGGAINEADAAFKDFEKAAKAEAIASKNVPVRLGSVMGGRSQSMRTVEVLVIEDATKAIKAIGLTEKIQQAILSSARDFKKEYGELPAGIGTTSERSF